MIIVRIYEGLGNQMFEYAYAYALSRRKGYREKVHIDIRDKEVSEWDKKRIYRPLEINQFCISLPIASKDMLRKWSYIENLSIMQKIIYQLAQKGIWKYKFLIESNYDKRYCRPGNDMYISGWFQHYEYFEKLRPKLLCEFTLKQNYIMPQELQYVMNNYEVVSLHVRRGDYINNQYARRLMSICGEDYYRKAVEYIKKRVNDAFLFVFTNDEKWVKSNLKFSIPNIVISNHYGLSDVQELILMSKCQHNIIANSTFSWWGAWLNTNKDKIVIAPERWFRKEDRNSIAVADWIKM